MSVIEEMVENYCNLYRSGNDSTDEDDVSLIMKRMKNKYPVNVAIVENDKTMNVTLIQRPYKYDTLYLANKVDGEPDKYYKYYKYKSQYENKQKKSTRDVMKDETLTPGMKKKKLGILREKRVCGNCGKIGGNKFTIDNGYLTVVCNAATPCDVGQQLNVSSSEHDNLRDSYTLINRNLNNIKKNIITTKLDYLFGYADEDTTLERFESFKNDMKLTSKEVNNARVNLTNTLNDKQRNQAQKIMDATVNQHIKQIRTLGKEYKFSNEGNSKSASASVSSASSVSSSNTGSSLSVGDVSIVDDEKRST
tara:strand:- start:348 stop:1268 length:921 start_codon:yes stop_codon:yes gene_type:complete